MVTKESEAEQQTRKLKEAVENQKKSWYELKDAREQMLSSREGELVTTQKLADELKTITDENGKVKLRI